MNQAAKFDLYQTVTDRVLALMEKHGANWTNPFNKKGGAYTPSNAVTGKAYRGINVFLLASTAYAQPLWAGYGQWQQRGCQVKRGEKGTMIVYWTILEREKIVAGKKQISKRPLLRYSNVFNVAQVEGKFADGLTAQAAIAEPVAEADMVAAADACFAATGADIQHSDNAQAYYSPALDMVHVPKRELFSATATSTATESYYSTLAHELTHWTGHKSRLNRDHTGRFGSPAYAFEELVAELGAAFLCAELGVSVTPRADHAQYLNNWKQCLQADSGAFVKAAGLAKHAAAYISGAADQQADEREAA